MGLICGYTSPRKLCEMFIPRDVQRVIERLYGKSYRVYGPGPSDELFDYAVEFMAPMRMIGINLNHEETKITKCNSAFAQKNIIAQSEIIQIDERYIKGQCVSNEEDNKLWGRLKSNGSSFVVLRAPKKLNQTGTHFMLD